MQEADFLAEIVANPDSVGPRLVLADWLTEQGDPRGEFIHVQCRLDELDLRDDSRIDLEYRQRALLVEHRLKWDKALREKTSARAFEYSRGLVEHIDLPASVFLESADEILSQCHYSRSV